jgi:hypothetical protein
MDARNEIVNFITYWATKTELPVQHFLSWLNLFPGRFYAWKNRVNLDNKHNGVIPKKHWLLPWEQRAIINYAQAHPNEGYRRMTFMMLDECVVAVSPSSVYRHLVKAKVLRNRLGHMNIGILIFRT